MAKIFTFKKRKDFLRVATQFYIATHNMVLQAAHSLSETDDIWVGYTSTKKIGHAVKRNKARRRLRAVVREVLQDLAYPHVDYVFIARQSTADCNFAELKKDTIYAIKKINKNFSASNDDKNVVSDENI